MALAGKKEWRLTMNLVIAFQILIPCFDLNVLVFIFSYWFSYSVTILKILLLGGSKPGTGQFWDQAGRFCFLVWKFEREFFQGMFKVKNYLKSNTLFTPANMFSSTVLNWMNIRNRELNNWISYMVYWRITLNSPTVQLADANSPMYKIE